MEFKGCIDSKFMKYLPSHVVGVLSQLPIVLEGIPKQNPDQRLDPPELEASYSGEANKLFLTARNCRLGVSGYENIDYSRFSVNMEHQQLKYVDRESKLEVAIGIIGRGQFLPGPITDDDIA
jgi:hypothetical protein